MRHIGEGGILMLIKLVAYKSAGRKQAHTDKTLRKQSAKLAEIVTVEKGQSDIFCKNISTQKLVRVPRMKAKKQTNSSTRGVHEGCL